MRTLTHIFFFAVEADSIAHRPVNVRAELQQARFNAENPTTDAEFKEAKDKFEAILANRSDAVAEKRSIARWFRKSKAETEALLGQALASAGHQDETTVLARFELTDHKGSSFVIRDPHTALITVGFTQDKRDWTDTPKKRTAEALAVRSLTTAHMAGRARGMPLNLKLCLKVKEPTALPAVDLTHCETVHKKKDPEKNGVPVDLTQESETEQDPSSSSVASNKKKNPYRKKTAATKDLSLAEGIKAMQEEEEEDGDYDDDDDQPLNVSRRTTRSRSGSAAPLKFPPKKKAKPLVAAAGGGSSGGRKDNDKSGDCNRQQPPSLKASASQRGESLSDLVLNYCALMAYFCGDIAHGFLNLEAASQEMCDEIVAAKERRAKRKRKQEDDKE